MSLQYITPSHVQYYEIKLREGMNKQLKMSKLMFHSRTPEPLILPQLSSRMIKRL